MEYYVKDFVAAGFPNISHSFNKSLSAEDIVNKFIGDNSYEFIKRNR